MTAPRRILAVADPGGSPVAIETAARLAEAHGAALEVAACVEPPHDLAILSRLAGEDPDRMIEEAAERARAALRETLAATVPERAIEPYLLVGKAYLEIVRHVARTGCDFVVKGAQPLPGLGRFVFASTDHHLMRKCPCPVWLQTPDAPRRPGRVVAAVDLDIGDAAEPETLAELNRRVVDAARTIAAPDAEILVLHAWDVPAEGLVWAFSGHRDARLSADRYVNEILESRHAAMRDFLSQVQAPGGPRLVPRLARGLPETAIREEAQAARADAVVIGTVARTGLSGVFIGNTAENIVNSLDCPVVAVKPAGFVSPLLRG